MGRKSSQKAARRAEKVQAKPVLVESTIRNEYDELYRDFVELTLLDHQLNAQLKQHNLLYGSGGGNWCTSVSSTSEAAIQQFRDHKFNLAKMSSSVREQYDFEKFCDAVRRSSDVSEHIFDDPDFRRLYKHMVDMGRISKVSGLDFDQMIDLFVDTNTTGTDPSQVIARYNNEKKKKKEGVVVVDGQQTEHVAASRKS